MLGLHRPCSWPLLLCQERFDPGLFAGVFTSGGSGAPQWLNGLIAEPGACREGWGEGAGGRGGRMPWYGCHALRQRVAGAPAGWCLRRPALPLPAHT